MIALIRKNLRLWGYGKSLALFTGCILFSISGRLNGGIAYERHILSAVSDHYYLTYFVLPIVLLSCFSFIDDDGEPVILRFQSYHSYFLKKWIGGGLIAVILTAVQTGAILLSGIGLPLGNEWNLAAGATEAELFSTLEQLFASPLQAFVCFTLYQLIGSWLIFGICMWIGHFTGRKWTIRIVIVLYVLSAVWIKLPAIQNIPLTSFNHLLILHHNFGEPARPWSTGFTLLLFMLTIMFSVRFAWRGHLPQLRLKCHGIAAYYSYIEVRNVSKSFSGRAILQNISLSVEQGTTVGLVGANGSGKSVLFKIICGFEKPDQGSVYVRGRQIGKNGRDFPADMGVFINSPGFIGIYSGFQNLKFLADIQGKIGEKEIRQTMTKVGLDPDNKAKVDNYSLGMKQKLGLAQAIMEGQDILILDEPFNALDYKTYEDVKAIIRMLKAEGKTIFLTSHHYKDIEQLCDQVYSLEDCQLLPITEEIAARYREMD